MHKYCGTGGSTQATGASVQRRRTFPFDTGAFFRASTCASANFIGTSNFPPCKVYYYTIFSAARALYNATAESHRSLSRGGAEGTLHFYVVTLLPGACTLYETRHALRAFDHHITSRCYGEQRCTGKPPFPRPTNLHMPPVQSQVCHSAYAPEPEPILKTYFVSIVGPAPNRKSNSLFPGVHLAYFRNSGFPSTVEIFPDLGAIAQQSTIV